MWRSLLLRREDGGIKLNGGVNQLPWGGTGSRQAIRYRGGREQTRDLKFHILRSCSFKRELGRYSPRTGEGKIVMSG